MMITKPAFFFDASRCTGCKTCLIACRDKNNWSPGVRWRRVAEYGGGDWSLAPDGTMSQSVFGYYLSIGCNHCDNPLCAAACPTTAMAADENGIVSVDPAKCVGCRYCLWACPYSAPQYDRTLGRVTKCDFCRDLLEQGRPPACAAACPTRALDYGNYDDLLAVHGPGADFAPLPDRSLTEPRLICLAPTQPRPAGSSSGKIANPEEVRDV